jgi:D-threonate/D-erythronate kinase
MRTILVADDLTGASDAGVQFAKTGARTTVWLDPAGALDDATADVVVVDMNSRAGTPEAAYARMREFATHLRPATPRNIVKKMDSTLRGHAGPEVRALLEALPSAFAIVAPAYPKNARTCVDGILRVDGIPVDQTDFGRDLFSPVRDARVAAHFDKPSVALTLDVIRAGAGSIAAFIDETRANGVRLAIADTQTDDDLNALVAIDALRNDILWVGSAGLIEVLPNDAPAEAVASVTPPQPVGPILFLVGSISAMTQRQIDNYAALGAGLTERVDPVAVLEGNVDLAVSRAALALASRRDVVFALDGDRTRVENALAWGERRGLDRARVSAELLTRFITAAEPLTAEASRGAIVLSGGDVARAFCGMYGVHGLALLAEAAPGIPVSRAIGADLLLVTKAGGFGIPQTYRDIITTLHPQVTA